jgi:methionyl-tRNA formyltransferase
MKVWRSRVENGDGEMVPGRIRRGGCDGILVETGQGLLELLEVQPQNKRRMEAQDCACGYCLTPGTVLN